MATTKLSAASRRGKKAPAWPLRPDPKVEVERRTAEQRAERLREQLNATKDRRKIVRLERELDVAIAEADVLGAQLEEQSKAEAALWADLWATPQANMWEQLAWSREVAQYVRLVIRSELGDLDAGKEARQWSDRLGLNPLALLRLRWEIERTEEAQDRGAERRQRTAAAKKAAAKKAGPKKADPRSILRAVPD